MKATLLDLAAVPMEKYTDYELTVLLSFAAMGILVLLIVITYFIIRAINDNKDNNNGDLE